MNFFNPANFNNAVVSQLAIIPFLIWSLFWKGVALWRAAKNEQRNWFVVILILNTFGIIEIVYLFKFAKHKLTIQEIKSWLTNYSK
jgi:hypothetical protein